MDLFSLMVLGGLGALGVAAAWAWGRDRRALPLSLPAPSDHPLGLQRRGDLWSGAWRDYRWSSCVSGGEEVLVLASPSLRLTLGEDAHPTASWTGPTGDAEFDAHHVVDWRRTAPAQLAADVREAVARVRGLGQFRAGTGMLELRWRTGHHPMEACAEALIEVADAASAASTQGLLADVSEPVELRRRLLKDGDVGRAALGEFLTSEHPELQLEAALRLRHGPTLGDLLRAGAPTRDGDSRALAALDRRSAEALLQTLLDDRLPNLDLALAVSEREGGSGVSDLWAAWWPHGSPTARARVAQHVLPRLIGRAVITVPQLAEALAMQLPSKLEEEVLASISAQATADDAAALQVAADQAPAHRTALRQLARRLLVEAGVTEGRVSIVAPGGEEGRVSVTQEDLSRSGRLSVARRGPGEQA